MNTQPRTKLGLATGGLFVLLASVGVLSCISPASHRSSATGGGSTSSISTAESPSSFNLQQLQANIQDASRIVRENNNDLWVLKEAFGQHQVDVNQMRQQLQLLQSEMQAMQQAAEQNRAELQQIRRDGQTLAHCTYDTNELIDSIELKRLKAFDWAAIVAETVNFVRSQTHQDGACRRSRYIAQRFLQATP